MALYYNAYADLDSNDLSGYIQSLELTYESETLDDTAMGDVFRSNAPGLKNWTATITFHQSFAAGELDSIVFPLVGTTFACEFRADAGSVSTSNPKYTGTGLLSSYNPLGGSVGDQHTTSITINCASDLTRATS